MSRTFGGFTFLLVALVISRAAPGAEEPATPVKGSQTATGDTTLLGSGTLQLMDNGPSSGPTTLTGGPPPNNIVPGSAPAGSALETISGLNTYTGGTTVTGGELILGNATANGNYWSSQPGNWTVSNGATLTLSGDISEFGAMDFAGYRGVGAATRTTPIPAGPVFYIITEGAGLGDSVRSVPCTGKETVLDAVGHVNGISQVSSTKIWIARPSPADHDKSTILNVDWEAISKRGINATNYTLMPGDRLVLGEDPQTTRTNLVGKKTAIIERLCGVVGLTESTLRGFHGASAADIEILSELARKGVFTDDEEMKGLLQEMLRHYANDREKAGPKATAEPKAGQGKEESSTSLKAYILEGSGTFKAVGQVAAGGTTVNAGSILVISGTASEAPPHELAMRPLPAYRIEAPDVISIELLKPSVAQPASVTGRYLVGPDGTVNLRRYGTVGVTGMTVAEARTAIQKQLAAHLESPEVAVDVVAYNSKVYYVITQGAGLGDSVRRLPSTGNETVLAAISQINGLSQVSSSKNIWIVRPLASDPQKPAILTVDWDGITRRGETATNYQIFPGDRVYIGEDPLITRTNLVGKKTAIVERMMGILGLTNSTLRGLDRDSATDDEVLKQLTEKGVFTDDAEMKAMVQEMIRLHAAEREKARSKETEKSKPGQ